MRHTIWLPSRGQRVFDDAGEIVAEVVCADKYYPATESFSVEVRRPDDQSKRRQAEVEDLNGLLDWKLIQWETP